MIEAVRQLCRQAGESQLAGAELALAHGNGGVIGLHRAVTLGRC